MQTHIILLRGINVSGKNIIRMPDLKLAFEKSGFRDVSTYIQSGNILLRSDLPDKANVKTRCERLIHDHFNLDVPIVVRNASELRKVLRNNPFLQDGDIDKSKLHVTFLSDIPDASGSGIPDAEAYLPDEFLILGTEIYLHCPNGYGRTKLNNTFFESRLHITATTRNWNTVVKLVELGDKTDSL